MRTIQNFSHLFSGDNLLRLYSTPHYAVIYIEFQNFYLRLTIILCHSGQN